MQNNRDQFCKNNKNGSSTCIDRTEKIQPLDLSCSNCSTRSSPKYTNWSLTEHRSTRFNPLGISFISCAHNRTTELWQWREEKTQTRQREEKTQTRQQEEKTQARQRSGAAEMRRHQWNGDKFFSLRVYRYIYNNICWLFILKFKLPN